MSKTPPGPRELRLQQRREERFELNQKRMREINRRKPDPSDVPKTGDAKLVKPGKKPR